jgi:hypothetical protein
MAYTFEYDDITVTVERPLVGTSLDADHLRNKILVAYGHVSGNPASDNRYRKIMAYVEVVARSQVSAPVPWWAHVDMTNEQVKDAFESFLKQDADLASEFETAIEATNVPKKTKTKAPVTSP